MSASHKKERSFAPGDRRDRLFCRDEKWIPRELALAGDDKQNVMTSKNVMRSKNLVCRQEWCG